ncbi:hypothetical protein N7497_010455 [Penicillium chrysogenum]|nr:hypothetical protein N7497_010455 [Penicillium chrysogenum]
MLKKVGGEGGDVMVALATNLGKSAKISSLTYKCISIWVYILIYNYEVTMCDDDDDHWHWKLGEYYPRDNHYVWAQVNCGCWGGSGHFSPPLYLLEAQLLHFPHLKPLDF